MFKKIDWKPPCILFSDDPICVILRAAIMILDPEVRLRFFMPDRDDGVPSQMDSTFYFLCPNSNLKSRDKVLQFLKEARRRSRIADIVFPQNESYWSELLLCADFGQEHDAVKIVGNVDSIMGPGDYIAKSYQGSMTAKAQALLEKADECYHMPLDRRPARLINIDPMHGKVKYRVLMDLAKDLSEQGVALFGEEERPLQAQLVGATTTRVAKICTCAGIAEARTKIGEFDIVVTDRKMLVRCNDASKLIKILGSEVAEVDNSTGAVLASKSLLHVVTQLIEGKNLVLYS